MNEETKRRLLERFAQMLSAVNQAPRTIDQIEALALNLREQIAQATMEEVGQEIGQGVEQQAHDPERTPTSAPAPDEAQAGKPYKTGAEPSACRVLCSCCRQSSAWYKGDRSRTIVTLAGSLTLSRRYYYCRRCRQGFCPIDAVLGLPRETGFTVRLQQEVAYLSSCLPFAQAVQTLHRLVGVSVSTRSAGRLCLKSAGQTALAFVAKRDARNLPLAFALPSRLPATMPEPEVLYIVADGIQTPMQQGSWRETKVGVVRSVFRDGRVDQESRYVAYLGSAEPFGERWESLAIDSGSLKARRVVVLGDGAAWLWSLAEKRFPCAVQILDFWHALEYVGAIAREAFGEGSTSAKEWLSLRASEMKKSKWDQVFEALGKVRSSAMEAVDTATRYFQNNASRMDYARYLKEGLSIGSGLAESACKRIVTQRLKGSGMRWSECGAQAVSTMRCLLLGGEWDAFVDFWNRPQWQNTLSPLA